MHGVWCFDALAGTLLVKLRCAHEIAPDRRCFRPGKWRLGGRRFCTPHHRIHLAIEASAKAAAEAVAEAAAQAVVQDAPPVDQSAAKAAAFDRIAKALNAGGRGTSVLAKIRAIMARARRVR